jgi:hypothetical protein
MKLIHQHGDVLLFKVNRVPNDAKRVASDGGRHVLAEGEATGHAHAIRDTAGSDLYVDSEGTLFLGVRTAVDLTHEEHATQTIEPGTYRVGRVREIDPFTEEIEEVKD